MTNRSYSLPEELEFNPVSPKFRNDPYETYRALQDQAPVFYKDGISGKEWVVSRYDDVVKGLKNPSFEKFDIVKEVKERAEYLGDELKYLTKLMENWIFFLEPPRHSNIRRHLTTWFSPAKIKAFVPEIEKIVNQSIEETRRSASFDVLNDFAAVVSFRSMCRMVGCESLESQETLDHAAELFKIVNPPIPLKAFSRMNAAAKYFIDEMNKVPDTYTETESLFSTLSQAVKRNEITQMELVGCISLLFSVGQDTTKHLIGNSLQALYTKPEKLAEVKGNIDLLHTAIYECGRYNAPVSMLPRIANADTSVAGVDIEKGERVFFLIGAACRDSIKFDQPHDLDISGHRKSTLFFGAGVHFCLGAHLAQAIAYHVIEKIVSTPSFELHLDKSQWLIDPGLRGLENLRGSWA